MNTFEQLVALNNSNMDTMIRFMNITVNGAERLASMSFNTARQILERNERSVRSAQESGDGQRSLAIWSELAQPAMQTAADYLPGMYRIVMQTQQEINQLLEERVTAFNREAREVTEDMTRQMGRAAEQGAQAVGRMGREGAQAAARMGQEAGQAAGRMGQEAGQAAGRMGQEAGQAAARAGQEAGQAAEKTAQAAPREGKEAGGEEGGRSRQQRGG